eukprot:TRINITY_DN2632_c0_g1_i2.p1 TRINITY_DN2632_c0_g1~~TRINITY_DN2632_c0_g1_i2.p1  ORF type:complete len:555 (-),score=181.17 TRINITY_DN2632_c0_g1_i2:148-1812(-)
MSAGQQEIRELHRKYRELLSQESKAAKSDKRKDAMDEQRSTINKIQQDNQLLKQELALEGQQSKSTSSSQAREHLDRLQNEGDAYTRKIELEKRRIAELDKELDTIKQRIFEQKHKMGGANASKENSQTMAKQIKILENRLDKSLKKYNELLARNKEYRNKIDQYRRERVVFDGIYKKLEREIHDRTKQMKEMVAKSEEVFRLRDEANEEMSKLKEQASKEQEDFEAEWRDLDKLIENDRQMKDLLRRQILKHAPKEKRGKLALEDEQKLKRKLAKGAWLIGKDKAQMQISQEKIASYEEAFTKIQQATGIEDLDEVVNRFIESEDKNYSLFNYVNQLARDIERLEAQVVTVRGEIDKYKGQGVNSDNQRKRILKDLEERLVKTKAKVEHYDNNYNSSMKTINQLKVGIHSIYSKIGCNTSNVTELLGNQGVTETNMMQYLGIIEQRTNEILQQYANAQGVSNLNDIDVGGGGSPLITASATASHVGPREMRIQPPGWGDMSSEEDSDDEADSRPLTMEELQRRTLRWQQGKAAPSPVKRPSSATRKSLDIDIR